jgi:hypothetical protein
LQRSPRIEYRGFGRYDRAGPLNLALGRIARRGATVSKTKFVEFRDVGFWTYDVGLAVFLKYLIDAAIPRSMFPDCRWLVEAISDWRRIAVIPDIGLEVDATWSASQLATFVELADEACVALARHEFYSADEITSWVLFDEFRIFPRGATHVQTGPVVELGRALIALVLGSLPIAPAGRQWLYGAPEGRMTI